MAAWCKVGVVAVLLGCHGGNNDALDASSQDARTADSGAVADATEGTITFLGETFTLGNAAVIELPPGPVPSFVEILNVADTCDVVINDIPDAETFNDEDAFVLVAGPIVTVDGTNSVNASVRILEAGADVGKRYRAPMGIEDFITITPVTDGFEVSLHLTFTIESDDNSGSDIGPVDPPAVIEVTRPAPFCPPQ